MNHEPVCCKCSIPMYPRKNGIPVVDISGGAIQQLWRADKWRCPKCKSEIAVGFGQHPVDCTDAGFARHLSYEKTQKHFTTCNWDTCLRGPDEAAEWKKEKEEV